jgi:hypothetical protein
MTSKLQRLSKGQYLAQLTTAVKVSFRWLGTRKTLTPEQRSRASQPFNAEKEFLSASQKLFDTRHPIYQKLTKLKGEIIAYWRMNTLPFTELGVRLIPRQQVDVFESVMMGYKETFALAVAELDAQFDELKTLARTRLGTLYNEANYPTDVAEHFGFEWAFPNVDPPSYLMELSPAVYEQERQKAASQMQEAVTLAQRAFAKEFKELVDFLQERLTPGEDGKKKVFRDSAVGNLAEFFDRFAKMNILGFEDIDKLVAEGRKLLEGIGPQDIRDLPGLGKDIATGLAGIGDQLAKMIIAKPRRKITALKPKENGTCNTTAATAADSSATSGTPPPPASGPTPPSGPAPSAAPTPAVHYAEAS